MAIFEVGEKVQYRSDNDWRDGVVFAVRTYESNGIVKKQTYLIDTGRNVHEHVVIRNPRNEMLGRRSSRIREEAFARGQLMTIDKSVEQAMELPNLPKVGTYVETVRQPKTVECNAEELRKT